jgi:O-antigen ligase
MAARAIPARPWVPATEFTRPLLPGRSWFIAALAAAAAFGITFAITASAGHGFATINEGLAVRTVAAMVPAAAAALAAYAVLKPWPAYPIALLLTPFWNAAGISLQIGPLQIILQTVFILALATGCLIQARVGPGSMRRSPARVRPAELTRRRFRDLSAYRFAEVGALMLMVLGLLSTLVSLDLITSASVLLHGIVEPVAMGAILVWMRPSRRNLVFVCISLGVAAGLGSVLNVLQALPQTTSLAGLQAHRLFFALVSFYNVGLFGTVLAMVIPLLFGVLFARRAVNMPKWLTALVAAMLAACLVGLFLSFSKSADLAVAAGTILLLVLLVKSWRRRAAIVLAAGMASTLLVPWPALVLQVAPSLDNAYRTAMVSLIGEARFDSWNPATAAGHGSIAERFYAIEGAVTMAESHPLLGIGLDEFRHYYVTLGYRPSEARARPDHAHSLFPEVAAELGWPAMVMVMAIFGSALWAMWRVYRAPPDELARALAAVLIASLVAWLIAATAFGCDIYRPVRDMSSDVVTAAVIVAAAIALARSTHESGPSRRIAG